MRRSIEGLGLVPPGIVVEHQNVGTDRIVVSDIDPVPQNVSGLNERNLAKSKLL